MEEATLAKLALMCRGWMNSHQALQRVYTFQLQVNNISVEYILNSHCQFGLNINCFFPLTAQALFQLMMGPVQYCVNWNVSHITPVYLLQEFPQVDMYMIWF